MKWFDGYRMRLVVAGFVTAILFGGGSAKADFTFGEPINLGPTVNSSVNELDPCISANGLELYFHSTRPGGYGNCDLWVTTRASIEHAWGEPIHLGPDFNTSNFEGTLGISPDGLELYFGSDGLPGGSGNCDLWKTSRATRSEPWGPPENLGPIINSSSNEAHPYISADGLSLYFADVVAPGSTPTRPGGYGGGDIWVSVRMATNEEWREPQNIGAIINSSYYDAAPCISSDGHVLFFHSDRPGGSGGIGEAAVDIWIAWRKTPDDPWEEPVNIGPPVNTSVGDAGPALSADGKTLYFFSGLGAGFGNWDLYQAPIIPIVDLNGDGIVNAADMCIMVDYWGTDEKLCDIGPTPLGDGIVDAQDLIVLAEHLFEEVSDPTLVAHWAMDESEGDIASDSAKDNDGTVNGEPTWQPEGGMVDGALQLDGFDDYVSTPFVLNPADGKFSVFAWIKGGEPGQAVLSQGGGANWLCTDSLEGSLMTELKGTGRGASVLMSQRGITDGNWHRIGLVWNGLYRTLYVDGIVVAEDTQNDLESSYNGLYIGTGNAMEPGTYFSGLIDDVRIYNRAITP